MLVPFEPPPGYVSDVTTFSAQQRWNNGDGFRFRHGRAETIGGEISMSSGGSLVNVRKIMAYEVSGVVRIAAAGTLLTSNIPNSTSNNITPASGWSTSSRYCLAMWGDDLLAHCSGGKLFTSVNGAQATEITQSPDVITCMIVTPTRQVMALGCNEEGSGTFNGRCIRFSNIEDNTDWTTSATNNAGEFILSGQEDIVSGCVFGDDVIVWTEGSMWLGRFIGDPAQPWTFTRIAGVGIIGLDAFAILDQSVYWINRNKGFNVYTASAGVTEIPCPVSIILRESFLILETVRACARPGKQEIWFGIGGASNTAPTHYAIYCVEESIAAQAPVWATGTFPTDASPLGAMTDSPLLLASSSTAATTFAGVEYNTGAGSKMMWLDAGDGSKTESALIESNDFYFENGGRRLMVRRFVPDFKTISDDVTVSVESRDWPMSTSAGPHTATIEPTDTKADFRKSGRLFRMRFDPTGFLRIGKPVFDVEPIGER